MSYIREKTVSTFSKEQLLHMVKECLNELDIPYEEKPGGFGVAKFLDPSMFELMSLETFTLEIYSSPETIYDPLDSLLNRSVSPDYAWEEIDKEQIFLAAA